MRQAQARLSDRRPVNGREGGGLSVQAGVPNVCDTIQLVDAGGRETALIRARHLPVNAAAKSIGCLPWSRAAVSRATKSSQSTNTGASGCVRLPAGRIRWNASSMGTATAKGAINRPEAGACPAIELRLKATPPPCAASSNAVNEVSRCSPEPASTWWAPAALSQLPQPWW